MMVSKVQPRGDTMNLPLQITFHGVTPSDAVAEKIRGRAGRLTRYCESIISCRVAVEAPHRHHAHGGHFRVRIEVSVPGERLIVGHDTDEHTMHADLYVAVRDAFDRVCRQLESYTTRERAYLRSRFA